LSHARWGVQHHEGIVSRGASTLAQNRFRACKQLLQECPLCIVKGLLVLEARSTSGRGEGFVTASSVSLLSIVDSLNALVQEAINAGYTFSLCVGHFASLSAREAGYR
jgi:hypothetical protein